MRSANRTEHREAIDVIELARQRRGEIETEAVDVHLAHPVAQRIHDQLQHVRVAHVQRVARARVVGVAARILFGRPVVRLVVESLEREHRSEVIAFARVVVDDVEDHFEVRRVQELHHTLEFADRADRISVRRVLVVRREIAVGVIAPVIAQPLVGEMLLVDELMHRQQLHRRDAERGEVIDGRRMRDARIRAAQMLRHLAMQLAEALDVHFVDHRLVQLAPRRTIAAPVKRIVDDDRLRHERRAVAIVALQVVAAERIGKDSVVPLDAAGDRLCVRIHQQLCRIAALPLRRIPRAMHAISVLLPGANSRQVSVPAEGRSFRKCNPCLAIGLVE